jgi:hypothetical protein
VQDAKEKVGRLGIEGAAGLRRGVFLSQSDEVREEVGPRRLVGLQEDEEERPGDFVAEDCVAYGGDRRLTFGDLQVWLPSAWPSTYSVATKPSNPSLMELSVGWSKPPELWVQAVSDAA